MKIRKIETNDEKNLKDLEEIHMTDDNSFLRKSLEDLRITLIRTEPRSEIRSVVGARSFTTLHHQQ